MNDVWVSFVVVWVSFVVVIHDVLQMMSFIPVWHTIYHLHIIWSNSRLFRQDLPNLGYIQLKYNKYMKRNIHVSKETYQTTKERHRHMICSIRRTNGRLTRSNPLCRLHPAAVRQWCEYSPYHLKRDLHNYKRDPHNDKRDPHIYKRDQYNNKWNQYISLAAAAAAMSRERPTNETYKRDLQKRPTKETNKRDQQKRPTKETNKKDQQKRPTKETNRRDQQTSKETDKRH